MLTFSQFQFNIVLPGQIKGVCEVNERLKELRKELGLTQEEFGDRIKVKRNTIAKYETNKGNPIDTVIFSICREFGVSEKWLRHGEEPKWLKSGGGLVDQITDAYGLSPLVKALLEGWIKLPADDKDSIERYVRGVLASMNIDIEAPNAVADAIENAQDALWKEQKRELTIDEKVELYRKRLESERGATASSTTSENIRIGGKAKVG